MTTSHDTQNKTAFIIGATSSLAQALARSLAARGYGLVLGGRDEEELRLMASDLAIRNGLHVDIVAFDFMDHGLSAEQLVADAPAFTHLIMVAGDMGAENPEDIRNLGYTMHMNYAMPAEIATAAALRLEAAGGGSIVIVSSVAGDRGRQSNYAYGSAKAALSTFASGLRNRFAKRSVHVMTVKPGFIDTPMTWGMQSPLIASRDYVAGKIVAAMEGGKDVVYVPFFWRYIMMIICAIPERIFKKLSL